MIRIATLEDEPACDAIALQHKHTKGFARPSLSLRAMRAEAFQNGEVLVAVKHGVVTGFVWCRPMKPRHMQFSTVYYIGVGGQGRSGTGSALMRAALRTAKARRIELICEHRNTAGMAFYEALGLSVVRLGVAGKISKIPYTRFFMEPK